MMILRRIKKIYSGLFVRISCWYYWSGNESVDNSNLKDNTIVVLESDHGWTLVKKITYIILCGKKAQSPFDYKIA